MELIEELVGASLDAMADLPRTVFLLRRLDGLEVTAMRLRCHIDNTELAAYYSVAFKSAGMKIFDL